MHRAKGLGAVVIVRIVSCTSSDAATGFLPPILEPNPEKRAFVERAGDDTWMLHEVRAELLEALKPIFKRLHKEEERSMPVQPVQPVARAAVATAGCVPIGALLLRKRSRVATLHQECSSALVPSNGRKKPKAATCTSDSSSKRKKSSKSKQILVEWEVDAQPGGKKTFSWYRAKVKSGRDGQFVIVYDDLDTEVVEEDEADSKDGLPQFRVVSEENLVRKWRPYSLGNHEVRVTLLSHSSGTRS